MGAPTFRWGFLGAARIAAKLADAVQQTGGRQIVQAVASRDAAKAGAFAKAHGVPAVYHGDDAYARLLADPSIHAVYIPLPNDLHRDWTVRALEAGKHVLCEKPLAMNAAEVDVMLRAARASGKTLAEAFMYRALARTEAVTDLVRSGALGEIRGMRGSFHFLLNRPLDIRWKPEHGGGALLDVGTYPISMARLWAGREPARVRAVEKKSATGVDLVTVGVLDFGAFWAEFSCGYDSAFTADFTVSGSEKSLRMHAPMFAGTAQDYELIVDRETVETVTVNGPTAYVAEVLAFQRQTEGGAPFMALEDSLGQAKVLDAIRRSAGADGGWTDVD